MKDGGIMRATVAASVALAAVSLISGFVTGNQVVGVGLAAGFVVGSLNGVFMLRLLDHHTPFVTASVARLALLSAIAVLVAFALSAQAWAVLLGVAGTQVVMAAAGVRRGLRA